MKTKVVIRNRRMLTDSLLGLIELTAGTLLSLPWLYLVETGKEGHLALIILLFMVAAFSLAALMFLDYYLEKRRAYLRWKFGKGGDRSSQQSKD